MTCTCAIIFARTYTYVYLRTSTYGVIYAIATKCIKMATESLAAGVDKELTCAICLCRYSNPKVLPCLHSYCRECLERLVKKARPDQELTCPQCKEVHGIPPDGVDAFKTYFTMNNLLELLRVHEATSSPFEGNAEKGAVLFCESGVDENTAVAHCLTCSDHLCEGCFELHKKQKLTREHNVVLLKDLQQLDRRTGIKSVRRVQRCEEHREEPLKLFCKTCKKVICRDCALVKHREHSYVFVHEFRPETQRRLEALVKTIDKKQVEFQVHSQQLAKVRESTLTAFNSSKEQLNAGFDKMIENIEIRRKALLSELETLALSQEKKLNAEAEYIEMSLARFSNSVQFTEKLFDNEDDVEVMLMSTEAIPALESLQQLSWDAERAHVMPVRVMFDQDAIKTCESIGCICRSLKDDDVIISDFPDKCSSHEPFSFSVSLPKEVAGSSDMDIKPLLSVLIAPQSSEASYSAVTSTQSSEASYNAVTSTQSSEASYRAATSEEPVQVHKTSSNTWTVSCTPTGSGSHKVRVQVDAVTKEQDVLVLPRLPAVGMKVTRGPDWKDLYKNEDGGNGAVGEVVRVLSNMKVNVKWPNGKTLDYRWGKDNAYDLKVVNTY